MGNCQVCGRPAIIEELKTDMVQTVCDRCGTYMVTGSFSAKDLSGREDTYLLSGVLRNASDRGTIIEIDTVNLDTLIQSNKRRDNPTEAAEQIVEYIASRSSYNGEYIKFTPELDLSILYAKTSREFIFYVECASQLGLVEKQGTNFAYRISLEGWRSISPRNKVSVKNQAFVAMWFTPELNDVWSNGFESAIITCGFKAVRIDQVEHNQKICDKILAEIKASKFIVADFSGQRGGVYFEAGFALGQGIPVIWTCKSDEIEALHFDTRQYNHIPWDSPEELAEKLAARIRAIIV